MKKIKAIKEFSGIGGKIVKTGQTIELDNGLAQNLVLRKRAEFVAEPAAPAEPNQSATSATKNKTNSPDKNGG